MDQVNSCRPSPVFYGTQQINRRSRLMHKPTTLFKLLAFPAGLAWLALPCHAERAESIQAAPVMVESAALVAVSAFLGEGLQPWSVSLPPVDGDWVVPDGGTTASGVVFPLPAPVTAAQLAWEPVAGGYAARVRVSAEPTKRLRLHLAVPDGLDSLQVRVQGTLDAAPVGPVGHADVFGNGIWLPVTNGNAADLEIFVSEPIPPPGLMLDAANVIAVDVTSGNAAGSVAKSLGLTAYKEYDVACWSKYAAYSALVQAASATAKVHFIQGGRSYICSGTLIADKGGTRTPWFATANHCLPDQATASTASFEWFFQATSCGGRAQDSRYAQTYGGAQLLYTNFKLEPAFLRLNRQPPSGVSFMGWDTSIQKGDLVWAVHHPGGDHTMVSEGKVTAILQTEIDASQGGTHLLDSVSFSYGGIEDGSSGSGLFGVSNGSLYWKGTLFGGPVDNYQIGSYSHLQSYYDNIKRWLENTTPYQPSGVSCLFNWAETNYHDVFSPAGANNQFTSPYTFRYYGGTNAYLGVSALDNHVYYLGPDNVLRDEGPLSYWLSESSCQ